MQKKCRRHKLTDAAVRKLRCEPGAKQISWWDDPAGPAHVRGLHVIIYKSGRACWHVRVRDRHAKSRYRVVRLGDVGEMSAQRARDTAAAEVLAARLGRRPDQRTGGPRDRAHRIGRCDGSLISQLGHQIEHEGIAVVRPTHLVGCDATRVLRGRTGRVLRQLRRSASHVRRTDSLWNF